MNGLSQNQGCKIIGTRFLLMTDVSREEAKKRREEKSSRIEMKVWEERVR